MTKLQEKAQGQAKQAVGQIVGNEKLVLDGKKQERRAEKDLDVEKSSKEKPHGKNVQKGAAQKPVFSEETRDPTGRTGPVLE